MLDMIYLLVLVILFVAMLCSLIRVGLGPTWLDRALSVNTFTTKIILVISVYLFAIGHPEYIDIALLYALINYVATLALVNYLNRHLSHHTETNTQEVSGD